MTRGRLVACALLLAIAHAVLGAGTNDLAAKLDAAGKLRASDKATARKMLDEVQRALASPQADPALVARAQLLECTWADDPAPALRSVAAGLAAAERTSDLALRAKLLDCRAQASSFGGNGADAERDYLAVAALAHRLHDEKMEAEALANMGDVQYTRGEMADALTSLQQAYRIDQRLGREKARLDDLSMMANVYADAQVAQYDRALEYYGQIAVGYGKLNLPKDVADTLFNLGATSETKGSYVAAEQHYRRALAAFEKLRLDSDVAYTQRALGSAIMKQGRAAEAVVLFDAALASYQREKNTAYIAWVRHSRGMAYRRLGRNDEALQELAAARAFYEKTNNVRFLEKIVEEVALVQAQRGDWRAAYEAEKEHEALQQKLATSRRDESSSRLRVEFDAAKKEQENRALARENTLRVTALRESQRSQKLQIVIIALTALLAIALAILFWRQVVNTRRMRAMALTDELTRLPNRRHILTAADIAFAAAKREGRAASVIAFDIDRFKRINDTYGHAAGDHVLQSVARTCRLELRQADLVGRTGGEEFLVILHDANAAQAGDVAERLRAAVERLDFSAIDPNLGVTISLGVWIATQYEPSVAIAAADTLLYRAKEGGRNRVEMDVASL